MTISFQGREYKTEEDLKVKTIGFFPQINLENKKLKKFFIEKYGRDFLGGDEIVSFAQKLVSSGMDFSNLEQEMVEMIENSPEDFEKSIFKKISSGIGRGHSLGGLSGIVLGVSGTKMIDSGLTGLCASRSLVTSSRRRETGKSEIIIPSALKNSKELLKEYIELSESVLEKASEFKEKFGKLGGIETFNKVVPYNNPADLFIVLPLDTLSTISGEVRQDSSNPNGSFLPREIHLLSSLLKEKLKQVGQEKMFSQRTRVPRDTYLHYNVFKDPQNHNYALEQGLLKRMSITPGTVSFNRDFTTGFYQELQKLKAKFEKIQNINEPSELHEASLEFMDSLRIFSNEYNESVGIKIADSLSWRVWSEQKRHATLRQSVESIYSAVERASVNLLGLQEKIDEKGVFPFLNELEKNIIIDDRLKNEPNLLSPYVDYTIQQLALYQKMLKEGFQERDALYIVPKNIRLRTLENYDLVNLIDLEFPLRLCTTCEPERKKTSWEKRDLFRMVLPELSEFLNPKCFVGFCTEGNYCGEIKKIRKNYDSELHKNVKKVMLEN